ncbi:SRPBCC domain-containing protein [Devosia sp. SL43]|uniref:SRPBCC domain-containing protein n=1 Tax=Devosia sp. SL43 TaxID=2806348 RepID=UPI001F397E45|nr:SRPBCC domain-containing protein [Devosia sp. SL43]UJW86318.1 SRPBCC domain-containing protein [Devosia sp. SL43]
MDNRQENDVVVSDGRTIVKRTSEREITVTRTFNAPARIVFEAWTNAGLFAQWWVPKSLGVPLRSCQMDVRTGGTYRLEFGQDAENTWAFFGKYIEVVVPERIVWTNEEGENEAISTVTFMEHDGKTLLTFSEVHPSKEALDESLGGMEGTPEQFAQLDELLITLGAGGGSAR